MTPGEFDSYCRSLPATTHVIQWGASSVWKVGGKIFAICSRWGPGDHTKISFKCSEMSFEILKERPGIVPAPYLARAGWVQLEDPTAMPDTDIRLYLQEAHAIIAGKLTRAQRRELGLTPRDQSDA